MSKGAEVIEVNPAQRGLLPPPTRNKMPLTILRNVDRFDMKAMQDEIFGPVLPVKTYRKIDEAIDYINAHDRPLGLYYFGEDNAEHEQVLTRTQSGGVTVNDVVFHASMEDLPFGGVGPSGMGSYHGHEGFQTFSHARAVFRQSKIDVAKLAGICPPYGKAILRTIAQGDEVRPNLAWPFRGFPPCALATRGLGRFATATNAIQPPFEAKWSISRNTCRS